MPAKSAEPYSIGRPFDISELNKPKIRAKTASPRDLALEKAITQATAGAESQVFPFFFDPAKDKVGTVKAAAVRVVKAMQVPVNVGYNKGLAGYENAILLSRGVLSNRGRTSR